MDGGARRGHDAQMTSPAFSYRDDPAVPAFPDDRPLIVFDGVCVLCSASARFVLRHDEAGRFRLTAAQSSVGQALYRHHRRATLSTTSSRGTDTGSSAAGRPVFCPRPITQSGSCDARVEGLKPPGMAAADSRRRANALTAADRSGEPRSARARPAAPKRRLEFRCALADIGGAGPLGPRLRSGFRAVVRG